MGLFKLIARLLFLVAAAFGGAAAGDLLRQRVTGEPGKVLFRTPDGDWSVEVTPQFLIPAVVAGLRADQRGLLRAAGTAALLAGSGGKGLGGIAGSFFPRHQ
jgi:hypothetical protein